MLRLANDMTLGNHENRFEIFIIAHKSGEPLAEVLRNGL